MINSSRVSVVSLVDRQSRVEEVEEHSTVRDDAEVSIEVVSTLKEVVGKLGFPFDAIMPPISRGDVVQGQDDGMRVPLSELYALCERALAETGEPALGLRWGELSSGVGFNMLPQIMLHAESLRHALDAVTRFSILVGGQRGVWWTEDEDTFSIVFRRHSQAPLPVRRMLGEMSVVGMCRLVRAFDEQAKPVSVTFDYAAPEYAAQYGWAFGGSESFEQSCTGLVFPRALLSAQRPLRDAGVYEAVRALAERRLRQATATSSYAARVRELLLEKPAPHCVSMQVAANELMISVRSLHRRLAEEGTSYASLTHEACSVTAKRLIGEEGRSIKETAFMMGFADPNSFHRAFKRWTGTTPGAYRRGGLEAN